ncbi:Cd(II)/Pb(II)-responsive transcriptional regulator [Massilia sp. G4R7]|uniref:Cd(II)/Pb(II)-responsive transcriptional regulator n=1 Tax=Massilia phyllostachyos TaxID=2898585 RepID=A0ABS8Q701_9BURK|nr:Cd(II)/Pb(II)-responsive transcriptional regulator [Massilia phyllostachyos]MCD2516736.1 Cd(II)/Pb(II)-responsive transcriptional regulator [Massilia phyllostachyos]
MKIGELADRSGCLVETIRYYERIGLLMPPERAANNYRTYTERHSERLSFIRHCRALDMSLDEVRLLLDFRDRPQAGCAGVNDLLDKHIGHVVERIEALTFLESQLRELRNRCVVDDTAASCAILRALSTEPSGESVAQKGHV